MRAVILQHDPIDGPGSLTSWLPRHTSTQELVRLYQGDTLPDPTKVDLLLILGGPMSVNDEEKFPWLRPEKVFIRQIIDRQRPVLGICLGAQLIASALGAKVRANRHKEIGWHEIEGVTSCSPLTLPSMPLFQWHGETFDLPDQAILLARTEACEHQAFLYRENILGLQFHPEVTPELVELFISTGNDEFVPSPYVQSPERILSTPRSHYQAANDLLEELLNRLIR